MQCPKTPRIDTQRSSELPFCTTFDTGTVKKRSLATQPALQSASSVQVLEDGIPTPCKRLRKAATDQDRPLSQEISPAKSSSCHPGQLEQFEDVFGLPSRSSSAFLQFHQAARRLVLSPLPANMQKPDVEDRISFQHPSEGTKNSNGSRISRSSGSTPPIHKQGLLERDIASAHKGMLYVQDRINTSQFNPVDMSTPPGYDSPRSSQSRRGRRSVNQNVARKSVNFSRLNRVPDESPANMRKQHFSRAGRPYQLTLTSRSDHSTPTRPKASSGKSTTAVLPCHTNSSGHPPMDKPLTSFDTTWSDDSRASNSQMRAAVGADQEPLQARIQNPASGLGHDPIRESFDSAVSECLGDKRRQLSKREIWLQRFLFSFFVFTVNIALGLVYLGSFKHPYLLAILVFMKSKDILSTIADILGLLHNIVRFWIWPPKKPSPRWVLSLVCAYAETEEQILKTVYSLARATTQPHKQVICVILDGKPRDILGKMSQVKMTVQRPYTTWRGIRGEIIVNAGYVEEIPIVLVQKIKNAGKKDSLILGHDLFNYPRKDMPHSTQLLRSEIWHKVLPSVVAASRDTLNSFDFIFCTDADSTIHEHAVRRLADALAKEDNAIAGCGVLFAEAGGKQTEYSPWHLFQQFQYTFGQYVRRQAESFWGRVSCLPGCITMIVVRPEMGPAISEYARPVTERNLFRHQVQYLGTDRRLTWCMLSQGKHLRTVFVPDALSETVVPNSAAHYVSQRRRWASNAYFNDFFYFLGPRQRLVTRLFAAIDIVRLTLVYYRVFNTGYFLHGLITNFYLVKIIPTLIVTKTPATWYLLLVLVKEPFLRRRLHKILLGMCINQIISPVLSVIVFTNVLFHIGSQAWGRTGTSTQGSAQPAPAHQQDDRPVETWTPRRLARSVRTAIRGMTPRRHPKSGKSEKAEKTDPVATPVVTHDKVEVEVEVGRASGATSKTGSNTQSRTHRSGVDHTTAPPAWSASEQKPRDKPSEKA